MVPLRVLYSNYRFTHLSPKVRYEMFRFQHSGQSRVYSKFLLKSSWMVVIFGSRMVMRHRLVLRVTKIGPSKRSLRHWGRVLEGDCRTSAPSSSLFASQPWAKCLHSPMSAMGCLNTGPMQFGQLIMNRASETVNQNKFFLFIIWFSLLFCYSNRKLTNANSGLWASSWSAGSVASWDPHGTSCIYAANREEGACFPLYNGRWPCIQII